MNPPPPISAPVVMTLLVGGGLLVVATALALRPRGMASFGWMLIAGLSCVILCLGAAAHFREGDGLRAAVAQLVAIGLAALLGGLCSSRGSGGHASAFAEVARPACSRPPRRSLRSDLAAAADKATYPPYSLALAAVGRGLAWLTLVGLPPTVGFPAKVMLYRALLAAGWGGMTVLAMAAGVAGLLPAFWAMRSPPRAVRGARGLLLVVLIGLVLALGLYPQPGLSLAGFAERSAQLP